MRLHPVCLLSFVRAAVLAAAVVPAVLSQTVDPYLPTQPVSLELGKEQAIILPPGGKHQYMIQLSANQLARIEIVQQGSDLVAKMLRADGSVIVEFDSEIRPSGKEPVELVATDAETFIIEVSAKLKSDVDVKYSISLLEIRESAENDRLMNESRLLMTESLKHSRAAKYAEAKTLAEKALAIRERIFGSEHPEVGVLANRIGILYSGMGDEPKAEEWVKRALEIYEKTLEPDDPDLGDAMNNYAVTQRLKGEYAAAEEFFKRSLAIRERSLGPDHSYVAGSYNNLGILYRNRGDYSRALAMYERALSIRERTIGKESMEVSRVLQSLATLYYYMGDYQAALREDLRIVAIREKNLPPDHPEIAAALTNLGLVYGDLGDYEKAKQLLGRALAIREKKFGRANPITAVTLFNLAKLHVQKGENAAAEKLYEEIVKTSESDPKALPDDLALQMHSFGSFYTSEGKFEKAEPLLIRALRIRESVFGPDNPEVARTCDALAKLYALKRDVQKAVSFQERANKINEKHLALNMAIGSEHQKLAYTAYLSEGLNQTIGLHAGIAPSNASARDLALTAILQRKGRVLDAMTNEREVLRQRLNENDRKLIDRINDVNARLSSLITSGPDGREAAKYQAEIDELHNQKDKLEVDLSRRSFGNYSRSETVSLDLVRSRIPSGTALVEFTVYKPLPSKSGEASETIPEPRYAAYILRKAGETAFVDIGTVKEIDALLGTLRPALRDSKRSDFRKYARAVDDKVMKPVRRLLKSETHLLISADGDLNLMPFEALIDESDRYLVESFAVTYLTSGRDLLRPESNRQVRNPGLLIANPAFGFPTAGQDKRLAADKAIADASARRSVTNTRNLSETFFAPISGTEREARNIQELFPQSRLLVGENATETTVKQADGPLILHLATHGFFLEDSNTAKSDAPAGSNTPNRMENPLARSGLAFAGANLRSGKKDDGVLTALEASGLDLWGTKLVVLSACDTGLGEVRNGEGVYGLRRAFVLAGAESLVMSLWPVSDQVTRELMTGYYRNLKDGMGRGESLRQVQLQMLKRPDRGHPFYWASFIQSGEWSSLRNDSRLQNR